MVRMVSQVPSGTSMYLFTSIYNVYTQYIQAFDTLSMAVLPVPVVPNRLDM